MATKAELFENNKLVQSVNVSLTRNEYSPGWMGLESIHLTGHNGAPSFFKLEIWADRELVNDGIGGDIYLETARALLCPATGNGEIICQTSALQGRKNVARSDIFEHAGKLYFLKLITEANPSIS